MRNYLFGLFMALLLTASFQVESAPIEKYEVSSTKYEVKIPLVSASAEGVASLSMQSLEVYRTLGYQLPSLTDLENALALKVPIYSVPLRDENKIVLVKDPKGFVERAIRHGMEYLAIKPMDKGDEYWETVPVFSIEKDLSLKPKTTTETVPEDSELLRLIPVSDFLRYN